MVARNTYLDYISPNKFEKRYNLKSSESQVFTGLVIVQFIGDISVFAKMAIMNELKRNGWLDTTVKG